MFKLINKHLMTEQLAAIGNRTFSDRYTRQPTTPDSAFQIEGGQLIVPVQDRRLQLSVWGVHTHSLPDHFPFTESGGRFFAPVIIPPGQTFRPLGIQISTGNPENIGVNIWIDNTRLSDPDSDPYVMFRHFMTHRSNPRQRFIFAHESIPPENNGRGQPLEVAIGQERAIDVVVFKLTDPRTPQQDSGNLIHLYPEKARPTAIARIPFSIRGKTPFE